MWRSGEPPLCLPDWSYLASAAYFLLAVVACTRHACCGVVRSPPAEESARRTWASSVTLLFLEVSVVFQTIAVFVTWVEYALDGERRGRALLSSVGLGVVLVDLLLNRCKVQAKHAWVLLVFLLAWAVEQVTWVSTGGDEREACYEVFDAEGLRSAASAVVAAVVVVALLFAYAALSAKRDKLMVRYGFGSDADSTGGGDVEEDLGEDAAVTRSISMTTMTFRAPPASERASVVNPIFAGSGSRMKRNPWPAASAGAGGAGAGERPSRRTSLASIETDMSSGELDAAENQTSGCSSARHSRESPAVAPADGSATALAAPTAATGSGGLLPSHASSWAGYGGGGAAAWVRSSRDVAAPPPRGGKGVAGGKGGHRRSNSRY
eukprot:g10847.t1